MSFAKTQREVFFTITFCVWVISITIRREVELLTSAILAGSCD